MPIIILEGIDGSGKSTLATRIAERWPGKSTIIHRGPIQSSVEEELIQPLLNLKPDELLIADRWHLSELIYGPLYRGQSRIDRLTLRRIEEVLDQQDAVRVVLQPPLGDVIERLHTRGEDFLADGDISHVYAAYYKLARAWGYTVLTDNGEAQAQQLITAATQVKLTWPSYQ